MKTKITIIITTLGILTACKKDYNCECSNLGGVYKRYTIHDTHKKASAKCSSDCSSCSFITEEHCELK